MQISKYEGTIFFLIGPVTGWPPKSKSQLARAEDKETIAEISVRPNGQLEFSVSAGGEITAHFESCELVVPEGTNMLLSAVWSEADVSLRINGEDLPPAEADPDDPHVVTSKDVKAESSIGNPDAEERCQEWIRWRNEKWDSIDNLASGVEDPRRPKSISEQKGDLMRAVSILIDDLKLAEQGDLYRLDVVIPALRSLLCWHGRHDPILLRIASLKNLPLPVFSVDESGLMEEVSSTATPALHLGTGGLAIQRRFRGQELIDLQEWLDQPMIAEYAGRGPLKNRRMIREHASTSSLGHYHKHTYREVDLARFVSSFGADQLARYFIQIGRVTARLGRYVLTEVT